MSTERLPTMFRGRDPGDAKAAARIWAHHEGLRLRTIASVRRREDIRDWPDDADPYVSLHAYEVTLVVDMPDSGVLPEPEPPTLWGTTPMT